MHMTINARDLKATSLLAGALALVSQIILTFPPVPDRIEQASGFVWIVCLVITFVSGGLLLGHSRAAGIITLAFG